MCRSSCRRFVKLMLFSSTHHSGAASCYVPSTNGSDAVVNKQILSQFSISITFTLARCIAQPFSGRHNSYLSNYATTGVAKILGKSRDVVALHKASVEPRGASIYSCANHVGFNWDMSIAEMVARPPDPLPFFARHTFHRWSRLLLCRTRTCSPARSWSAS